MPQDYEVDLPLSTGFYIARYGSGEHTVVHVLARPYGEADVFHLGCERIAQIPTGSNDNHEFKLLRRLVVPQPVAGEFA